MWGLFDSGSPVRNLMQAANLAAFAYVTYDFFTNPEAAISSYGFELVTTAFSAYSLGHKEGFWPPMFNSMLNMARVGGIGTEMVHGVGGFSMLYSALGMANHVLTPVADFATAEFK